MSMLLHGDCLEHMKHLDAESVDLIFCDLPYGQTGCQWDCKIDHEKFWDQIMRIKKLRTPIFMTTTTKFGIELIQSAPKKCPFRYDLVWVKSAPCGFLSAKKMPMRKHEMIYVFYEKYINIYIHKYISMHITIQTYINTYKCTICIYIRLYMSGNHKGGRCKGVRCDFDLGPKYVQTSNGHNSSPLALEIKVFLSIYLI